MKAQLGQLMFIGLKGLTLGKDEADFIVKNNIGGVILFARNYENPEQLHSLCSEIHALSAKQPDKLPMFIGVDQEGGRVIRFKAPFTKWPAARKIGDLDSTSLAFKYANSLGLELRAVGVNLNFAPSVDVLTNPKNTVIGDRSYGTDAEHVAKMASAVVRGFIKSEIIPCAKHFPGHGNTLVDSHLALPIEETTLEALKERELTPFKKAIRARLDMIMTSHIRFNKIDPEFPVTLSEKMIKGLLRNELRFRGLVITDDLGMKAMSDNFSVEKIPVLALKAGCDLLLYCNEFNDPPVAIAAIEKAMTDGDLSKIAIQESYTKVIEVKRKKLPPLSDWSEAKAWIGSSENLKICEAIERGEVPPDLMGPA